MRLYSNIVVFLAIALSFAVSTGPAHPSTSVEKEIELGLSAARSMERTYPVSTNQVWQAEASRLGKSLLPFVNRKALPYTFTIIQKCVYGENELEAVSFPGGPVFISERLWRLLTPDERAGVFAHEIAHVDKGDSVSWMREVKRRGLQNGVFLPDLESDRATWTSSESLAIAALLVTMKFSRKQERDADLASIDLLKSAGISPIGTVTAMRKLLRMEVEPANKDEKLLYEHPETKTRIEYLTKRCIELGIKSEDLEAKPPLQIELPDRIGTVSESNKDPRLIRINSTRDIAQHDHVWIKKLLWDDEARKVLPVPIAYGHTTEQGRSSGVQVTLIPPFEMIDIEAGDQVYPLKPCDHSGALGAVKSYTSDPLRIVVSVDGALTVGEPVWIKDVRWDEKSKTVAPKPIAYGAVVRILNGEAQIAARMLPGHSRETIDQDCRIYARKIINDKGFLGEVFATWENPLRVAASTDRELAKGEEVWVKLLDWGESVDALIGRPVAVGAVTVPGTRPEIRLKELHRFPLEVLDENAGVYLRDASETVSRVGAVTSTDKRKSKITFGTSVEVEPGQTICVKKQLWDASSQSLITLKIAKGTIVTSGKKATATVTAELDSEFDEIEAGDEVYLDG